MTPPLAGALRLLGPAPSLASRSLPKPPLGLKAWSPTAEAMAVLLDAAGDSDPRTLAGAAAQLPHASTLPSGTPVFVLATATAARSFWRLFSRGVPISRACRCTALLARGYVDIGADSVNGDDLAWGHAP